MIIRVDFFQPQQISPMEDQDKLEVRFLNISYFVSDQLKIPLHPSCHKLYKKVTKQIPDNNVNRAIEENAEISKHFLNILLLIAFCLNFVFIGAGDYMLAMIRSL